MPGLRFDAEVLPALAACEASSFYGKTIITWEAGKVVEFEAQQRIRLPDQLRLFIRRLLGGKLAPPPT